MFVPRIGVECWLDGVTRNGADICRSMQCNDTETRYEARCDKTAPMPDNLEIELESPYYSRGSTFRLETKCVSI